MYHHNMNVARLFSGLNICINVLAFLEKKTFVRVK